jgi:hypothetical protein
LTKEGTVKVFVGDTVRLKSLVYKAHKF